MNDFHYMCDAIDGGIGVKTAHEEFINWQAYTTFLTPWQVTDISTNFSAIIDEVVLNVPFRNTLYEHQSVTPVYVPLPQWSEIARKTMQNDLLTNSSSFGGFNSFEAAPETQNSATQPPPDTPASYTYFKHSTTHQKLMSAPPSIPLDTPNDELPEFRMRKQRGKGATIYVVDSGCQLSHPEFKKHSGRTSRYYTVPNKIPLGLTI